jgi:exoribonuclease R
MALIIGIIEYTSKTVFGFSQSSNQPLYLFHPIDTSIKPFLVSSSKECKTKNWLALSKITNNQGRIGRGFIEIYIGQCGDYKSELSAISWRYSNVRWNLKNTPKIIAPSEGTDRMDLTEYPTINIDPEGCTDIDDCITVWDNNIAITIADVHEWMKVNPSIAEKASKCAQTFYCRGKIESPMLPSQLSDNLCSLIPGERRLGIAITFEWDKTSINKIGLRKVIIKNKKAYSYENVKQATDFPVETIKNVASFIAGCELTDPHDWIETLMVFYNQHIAEYLAEIGNGIWRGHNAPDVEKMVKYESLGADISILANSSAKYTDTPATHWGLGNIIYCHASSPIRRWSDVINQSFVKNEPLNLEVDLKHLNNVFSNSKNFERDVFFLDKLFYNLDKKVFCSIVLDSNDTRARVWVPEWKRIITIPASGYKFGEKIKELSYYINLNGITWKQRMVFKDEDINYLE